MSIAHLCEATFMVLVHPHGAPPPGPSRPLSQLSRRLTLSFFFCLLLVATFTPSAAARDPTDRRLLASIAPVADASLNKRDILGIGHNDLPSIPDVAKSIASHLASPFALDTPPDDATSVVSSASTSTEAPTSAASSAPASSTETSSDAAPSTTDPAGVSTSSVTATETTSDASISTSPTDSSSESIASATETPTDTATATITSITDSVSATSTDTLSTSDTGTFATASSTSNITDTATATPPPNSTLTSAPATSTGGGIITVTISDGEITIPISNLPGTIVVEPSGGAPNDTTTQSAGFITIFKTITPNATTATITQTSTTSVEETIVSTVVGPGSTFLETITETRISTVQVVTTQVSSPEQAGLLPVNAANAASSPLVMSMVSAMSVSILCCVLGARFTL